MLEVQKLYPQYMVVNDRRKKTVPVVFERRSGGERRSNDRVGLDTNLTRDLYEVKNRVSMLEKTAPQLLEKVSFTSNASKVASNSIKTDQFVKTQADNPVNKMPPDKDSPSATTLMGGILAIAMCGVVASTLLGTAGAVIAVGFGAYFAGKALKQIIVSHMVDDEIKDRKR